MAAGGDVVMRVSGICEGCGDAATQLAPLRLLDGEVALELRVPDLFGDLIRVAATLAAHDNYLTGAFAVSVAGREDPAEDEPWPPTGVLSLERVLPAETF